MRLIGPVATLTLVLASNASAQAGRAVAEKADRSGTPSPLRQFSRSIQALVTGVSPSVVQIIATGYGPHEGSRAAAELALGRQANADVKSALAGLCEDQVSSRTT